MVAERAPEQKQSGQRQEVGIDHPLHFGSANAVACADRRQRDVEYRAVDEREARREDAGDQGPARVTAPGFGPPGVARAQSTCCAMAASTMLRHVSASPTAAIASSGSRIVCRTASAWFTCSRQAM